MIQEPKYEKISEFPELYLIHGENHDYISTSKPFLIKDFDCEKITAILTNRKVQQND